MAKIEYGSNDYEVSNETLNDISERFKEDFPYISEDTRTDMIGCILDNLTIEIEQEEENIDNQLYQEAYENIRNTVERYDALLTEHNDYTPRNAVKGTIDFFSPEAEAYEKEWQKVIEKHEPEKEIDVVDYITLDSIHLFVKCMLNGIYSLTNDNRKKAGLEEFDRSHIFVSCRYRAAYLEYDGKMYKDIENDSRYNTYDDDLLSMFFLKHIYNEGAYHNEGGIYYYFIGQEGNDKTMLTERRYKGLFMGNLKNCLLKDLYAQYPEYVFTKQDREDLIQFFSRRLYRPDTDQRRNNE